ncbi:hypothetical protein [Actinokineospora diospyrosa]|uniref:Excreted virulence factor EspC (Type VII ESX diderm) n=1 Tax=Actinokineospora diospyrosa TaxID=103728 RepID=A0ABT1I8G2_9PSEU|nr:hypothetical protein [Actinokineospora diospyrosa]MCP2268918.1 hypothetical protein [Actinokineospora diospyrosa]
MDGYNVNVEGLRRAAKAADSAGDQAAQVKLGEAVTPVSEAMPGSASAGQAKALAAAWNNRMRDWSADIVLLSGNITTSANDYEKDEAAAAQDFDVLGNVLRFGI